MSCRVATPLTRSAYKKSGKIRLLFMQAENGFAIMEKAYRTFVQVPRALHNTVMVLCWYKVNKTLLIDPFTFILRSVIVVTKAQKSVSRSTDRNY